MLQGIMVLPNLATHALTQVFGHSVKRRHCAIHADSGKARGRIGFDNQD
jgi:hypothetical protein